MTTLILPASSPRPADSAQFGVALIDAGDVLIAHPTLNVVAVSAKKTATVDVEFHLAAFSQHELAEIEKVVEGRRITRYEGSGDKRTAWWSGTLDAIAVVYAVPAPEPAPIKGVQIVCADCDPPAPVFAIDGDGVAAYLDHVRDTHARRAISGGTPLAVIERTGEVS